MKKMKDYYVSVKAICFWLKKSICSQSFGFLIEICQKFGFWSKFVEIFLIFFCLKVKFCRIFVCKETICQKFGFFDQNLSKFCLFRSKFVEIIFFLFKGQILSKFLFTRTQFVRNLGFWSKFVKFLLIFCLKVKFCRNFCLEGHNLSKIWFFC